MSLFASLATMLRASRPGGGRHPEAATERSLLALWHDVVHELPGLISDRVTLLSLELHRASRAFAQLAVAGVLALLFGATAWFMIWGGITAGLIEAGLHWAWAIAIAVVVNLLGAWLAVRRAIALAPRLALPATLRHMTLSPRAGDGLDADTTTSMPMDPLDGRPLSSPGLGS